MLLFVNLYKSTKHYLGMCIKIENTFENDTHHIRNHLRQLRDCFGNVKNMGFRRFQVLRNAFNPSIEQILLMLDELTKASQK